MGDQKLSSSMEDYLEVILQLSREGQGVRVKEIAQALGVSLPSVTAALKTLAEAGLVRHERYRSVDLTPEGMEKARALSDRHEALVRFLADILLIEESVAEKEACQMEHAIGPLTLQRLVNFLQSVQHCPRGDPRWLARLHGRWRGGHCEEPCDDCVLVLESPLEPELVEPRGHGVESAVRPLSECAPGTVGVVRAVLARGPYRRRLADMGIGRGVGVEVERVAPLGDPMDVKVRGYHLCLRKEEASAILVETEPR